MKKLLITIIIMFSFLLGGCSSNDKEVKKDNKNIRNIEEHSNKINLQDEKVKFIINEMEPDKSKPFKLGMSIDRVKSILEKNNIKIDNEIEITSDFNDKHFGDKELSTESIIFDFDKKYNKLYAITSTKDVNTSLDLKIGDSIDKMKKLYGISYDTKSTSDGEVYLYNMKNYYFFVYTEDGKVMKWGIKNITDK
ncbi:hypothetical protein DP145_09040 [Clostridium tetani]|uniref:hypothetical protein n=1 Tax=Clostridium tetani TaxID=1513 RepID=UPI00100B9A0D|nr:hypothetical protein [Clostridium tetani]RXI45182.1 hypothetical protein DP126_09365 [Clostridium tetani]RXM60352.1 hypothetical protein DP138_08735 [Clostridium tetani]RXM66160.1 hypothetical protein DP145_09040 [Clostridium tetani]